jgi:hypothetical protein
MKEKAPCFACPQFHPTKPHPLEHRTIISLSIQHQRKLNILVSFDEIA